MKPLHPELLSALAEQPESFGPIWSGAATNLATIAADLGTDVARRQSFLGALASGYFTQYTAYSDQRFAATVAEAINHKILDVLPDQAEDRQLESMASRRLLSGPREGPSRVGDRGEGRANLLSLRPERTQIDGSCLLSQHFGRARPAEQGSSSAGPGRLDEWTSSQN